MSERGRKRAIEKRGIITNIEGEKEWRDAERRREKGEREVKKVIL